jgi:hypothetical protein
MSQLLQTRVAFLESQVDLLETELSSLNDLLLHCGFPEGIKTLKTTVEELLAGGLEDDAEHQNF